MYAYTRQQQNNKTYKQVCQQKTSKKLLKAYTPVN